MDWRPDQGRAPCDTTLIASRARGWGRGSAHAFAGWWANRRVPAFLNRIFGGAPSCWSTRRRVCTGAIAGLFLLIVCPLLFLAWQIQRGGMGLDMVTPWIARSLSDQLGDGRTVTIGAAVIVRDGSGNVEIEARDVVVHDGDGRRVASMPRVALGLDSLPILGRRQHARRLHR